ncbi:MAG: nuclear transport factor 2 family protein [Phycisphaerales bacterium JB043]
MRCLLCVACAAVVFMGGCVRIHPTMRLAVEHVERFNARDIEGIASGVTEDVGWYVVDGDEITPMSVGRDALVEGLGSYFESLPSVRAEVDHVHGDGSFAVVRERVVWEGSDGEERSQSSYSVYRFRDGLIESVWYFEAE